MRNHFDAGLQYKPSADELLDEFPRRNALHRRLTDLQKAGLATIVTVLGAVVLVFVVIL